MIKISYVDTDQYQINDNIISLDKQSTINLLQGGFNVSGSINELLDNLGIQGNISIEEKNDVKEVEGNSNMEDLKLQFTDFKKPLMEFFLKYSFRTTDDNGVVRYYILVDNKVVLARNS